MTLQVKTLLKQHPHLFYQLLWVPYLLWFFWLDGRTQPRYILHSVLDDLIPFNEWFALPYCSWFFLLAGVTAFLWWHDTKSYDKLVLMMFSGMFFCLIVYMILPNGLALRPVGVTRQNLGMWIMNLLWAADDPVNVCPSIHCQSSVAMALAFSQAKGIRGNRLPAVIAFCWAGLICVSTLFTKQHSVWDVLLGVLLVLPWYLVLYRQKNRRAASAQNQETEGA